MQLFNSAESKSLDEGRGRQLSRRDGDAGLWGLAFGCSCHRFTMLSQKIVEVSVLDHDEMMVLGRCNWNW